MISWEWEIFFSSSFFFFSIFSSPQTKFPSRRKSWYSIFNFCPIWKRNFLPSLPPLYRIFISWVWSSPFSLSLRTLGSLFFTQVFFSFLFRRVFNFEFGSGRATWRHLVRSDILHSLPSFLPPRSLNMNKLSAICSHSLPQEKILFEVPFQEIEPGSPCGFKLYRA